MDDDFEVYQSDAGFFVVYHDDPALVVDDDPDRALKAMDDFIRDAQVAREELIGLINSAEA